MTKMELFDRFLQERTYLKGVSSDTLAYYRTCVVHSKTILAEPTKQGMLESIQRLLAGGVSPIFVNTYLRVALRSLSSAPLALAAVKPQRFVAWLPCSLIHKLGKRLSGHPW